MTLLPSDNEREALSIVVSLSRCEPLGTRTGRGLKAAGTHQKLSRGPPFYTHPVFLGRSILHEGELKMLRQLEG